MNVLPEDVNTHPCTSVRPLSADPGFGADTYANFWMAVPVSAGLTLTGLSLGGDDSLLTQHSTLTFDTVEWNVMSTVAPNIASSVTAILLCSLQVKEG